MSRFSRTREEQVQDVRRSPLDRFMEFAATSHPQQQSGKGSNISCISAKQKPSELGIFRIFRWGKVKGIYRKIPSERTRLVGGHAISGQLRTINDF